MLFRSFAWSSSPYAMTFYSSISRNNYGIDVSKRNLSSKDEFSKTRDESALFARYYEFDDNDDEKSLSDKIYCENDRSCHNASSSTTATTALKISVLILIAFSLTDITFSLTDAQMESLEAQDHYDALSADVIRPAFRYGDRRSTTMMSKARPSMSLGSAAISSVTSTLSPILPFTGGLDLRREDYWAKEWFGSFYYILEKVRGVLEIGRAHV